MDEYLPVNAAEVKASHADITSRFVKQCSIFQEDWNLDLFQGGFPRMDG